MTSESQHPGHEPDDATPNRAGSAWPGSQASWPADQAAQRRDLGVPDMSWAPPPPAQAQQPGVSWTIPLNGASPTPAAPAGGFPPDAAAAPERGAGFPPEWAPAPERSVGFPSSWAPAGGQPSDAGGFPPDWTPSPDRGSDSAATGPMADPQPWGGPPSWEAPGPMSEPVTPGGRQPDWDVPRTPSSPPPNLFGAPSAASETSLPYREPGQFERETPETHWPEPSAAPARYDLGQSEYPSFAQAPASPEAGAHEPAQRDYPAYQPGPGAGFAASAAVPLPPQETRVPGASLAATPPADFDPSPYPPHPGADRPYEPAGTEHAYAGQTGRPVEQAMAGDGAQQQAWAPEGFDPSVRAEAPQAQATGFAPVGAQPAVPAPRTPGDPPVMGRISVPQEATPDPASAGPASSPAVSASASVPVASRVAPPVDYGLQPTGSPTPQPRVYGRPATPEPAENPYGGPDQQPSSPMGVYGDLARHGDVPGAFGDRPPRPASGSARVAPPAVMPTAPPRDETAAASGAAFAPYADLIGDERTRPGPGVDPTSPATGMARPVSPATGVARTAGPPQPGAGPWDAPGFAGGPDQLASQGGMPHPMAIGDHGGAPTALGPAGRPGGAPMAPTSGPFGGPGAFPGPVAWAPPEQRDQPRFDSFSPQPEPAAEPPAPHVRNGRVLAAVLAAAVLLLVVPLGIVWLLTRGGGPAFDPAVGACVKQEGSSGAVTANCGDPGAFTVVSKVDSPTKCADQTQPHIDVKTSGGDKRVLCLGPAPSAATPDPATTSGG